MIQAARASGLGAVVTGMMETSIGLAAALHVAAAAESLAGACGIGTAELLTRDVVAGPLPVEDGGIAIPSGPGLGVTPDRGRVEKLRVAAGGVGG